jgi:broad specificity phosphatase PhoE
VQVILVRHGETASNRERLALGRNDVPLNDLGLRQARRLAAWLEADPVRHRLTALYSSPLTRARQTAEAIGERLGLPVVEAAELTEMDVGEMDGLTGPELRQRHPDFMRAWFSREAGTARMPGGESLAEVQERAWRLIERLREEHEPEAAVVAVSHNFVIRALVCKALAIDLADFRRFEQELASLTRIEFRGPRTLVTALNETCHLGGLDREPDYWAERG